MQHGKLASTAVGTARTYYMKKYNLVGIIQWLLESKRKANS